MIRIKVVIIKIIVKIRVKLFGMQENNVRVIRVMLFIKGVKIDILIVIVNKAIKRRIK